MATSPAPPVAFNGHCAIVHNNTLFVYQPDAFQTLELTEGAKWQQEQNGVSVTGGVCVKGGIEGDRNRPALYIVGGNTSNTTYPGLQMYSIMDKTWTTITPDVQVTAQRQFHGAAYLNASSALIMYGGSQDGTPTPSTETFLLLMYAPYRVQAYSSNAPPVVSPQIHSWDQERAVMVGGSAVNQNVFVFHPDTSWQDLGVTLPEPLPDRSVAETSLVILDDNSKVLMTYHMDQSPNTVSRNVLMGPFNRPAQQGQTIGDPASGSGPTSSRFVRSRKRSVFLESYPTYNSTEAQSTTRTNFAVAQGSNELAAVVGGDSSDSTVVFSKIDNTWLSSDSIFGAQQPIVSTTPSATPSPTASDSPTASTSAAAPPPSTNSGPNSLAILGGVLGGICGLAAILIILLLWLRHAKKKRAQPAQNGNHAPNPEEGKSSFEELSVHPLANQGQPMGRSPVPSAVVDDRDSTAFFNHKFNEKAFEAGATNKAHQPVGSGLLNKNPFTRNQSNLTISKPMLADLGDYKERPSIELGKATPTAPIQAGPSNLRTVASALPEVENDLHNDQRKTDEGWAAYFQSFQAEEDKNKRDTMATNTSSYTSTTVPSRSGQGGFWPGSGVPASTRSSKAPPSRDEVRAEIMTNTVVAASPTLRNGPSNPKTLTMSTMEGIPAKISRAESVSTDDEEYEDDRMSAYSSGVPQVAQHTSWTPFGNGSSGHIPTVVNMRGSNAITLDSGPATTISHDTSNSGTTKSSIPAFPMPAATIRRIQPSGELQPPKMIDPTEYRTSEDYFGRSPGIPITAAPPREIPMTSGPTSTAVPGTSRQSYQRPLPPPKPTTDSTDMSWINLGTPNQ